MKGYEDLTVAEIEARNLRIGAKQALRPTQLAPKRRSKYGATPTTMDGITFHSAKEAARYGELRLLVNAGQVRELRWQPRYALFACQIERANLHDCNAGTIGHRRIVVCEYVADFEYQELTHPGGIWCRVVEDVKSSATRKKDIYRLKKKMFEAQYGYTIRET